MSNNNNENNGGWITLSTHLLPEKDLLMLRDLQPGTWHDLIMSATNDAGRREAEYSFATLTETGATVEPLHAFESRMGNTLLGGGNGGNGFYSSSSSSSSSTLLSSLFEDPMIFIPTLCTVVVLLVVAGTSAFLYVMRIRNESSMHGVTDGGDETCKSYIYYLFFRLGVYVCACKR